MVYLVLYKETRKKHSKNAARFGWVFVLTKSASTEVLTAFGVEIAGFFFREKQQTRAMFPTDDGRPMPS
jgi:hypothetical protein